MAKLISTKAHRAGQAVTIAIIGQVTFDSNCSVEIPDEGIAKRLRDYLTGKERLGYVVVLAGDKEEVTTSKKKLVASVENTLTEDEDKSTETEEDSSNEDEEDSDQGGENSELLQTLQSLTKDELQKMATEAKLPEQEWSKKNTKALKKYLAEKLA